MFGSFRGSIVSLSGGESCIRQGLPAATTFLSREGYTSLYDHRTKTPIYTYERITSETLSGSASRKKRKFQEDREVHPLQRSKLSDYKDSGYDKGHHRPAANSKKSKEAMKDSFLLSNASPQNRGLNKGMWAILEQYVRDLTQKYDVVEDYTGGLFLPEVGPDGKKRVSYEVIGEGCVAVPTHFYKVLFLYQDDTVRKKAFIIPNKNVNAKGNLMDFLSTVKKVEKVSGIAFS